MQYLFRSTVTEPQKPKCPILCATCRDPSRYDNEPGEEIDLAGQKLTQLPFQIFKPQVDSLKLNFNRITQLTTLIAEVETADCWTTLASLTELWLHQNDIENVPEQFGSLTNLVTLFMNTNRIKEIPPQFKYLQKLTVLHLHDNLLTQVPLELFELQNLRDLWLAKNQLTELPPQIQQLTNLKKLNLSENRLEKVPDEICSMASLDVIWLNNNLLTSVPDSIGELLVSQLWLDDNFIGSLDNMILPEAVNSNPNHSFLKLTHLGISNNQLKDIPKGIGFLKLEELYMQYNHLSEAPLCLVHMGPTLQLIKIEQRKTWFGLPLEYKEALKGTKFYLGQQLSSDFEHREGDILRVPRTPPVGYLSIFGEVTQ